MGRDQSVRGSHRTDLLNLRCQPQEGKASLAKLKKPKQSSQTKAGSHVVQGRRCQDQIKEIQNVSRHPPDQRFFPLLISSRSHLRKKQQMGQRGAARWGCRQCRHRQRVSLGQTPFVQAKSQPAALRAPENQVQNPQ